MALKIGRALAVARQLDMLWENWRQLIALGFLEGNTVTIEGHTGSTLEARHGLGRVPRGWIVLRSRNLIVYYESAADSSTITFEVSPVSTSNTLTLLVY